MPSLSKLMFDGQYLGHIEQLHKSLKFLSAKARINLLRENSNMEEDDWREKVSVLKDLSESYRSLAYSDEPSDEDSQDDY